MLVDISGLQLDWAPAAEVFVTAVTAAGGWPLARLALFGADPAATERLRSCRVTEAMPVVATRDEAAALVGTRPARLSRGIDLPAVPGSVDARPRVPPRHLPPLGSSGARRRGGGRRRAGGQRRRAHGHRAPAPPRARPHRAPGVGPRRRAGDPLRQAAACARWPAGADRGECCTTATARRSGRTCPSPAAAPRRSPPSTSRTPHLATARPPTLAAPRRRRFTTADPEQADAFLRTRLRLAHDAFRRHRPVGLSPRVRRSRDAPLRGRAHPPVRGRREPVRARRRARGPPPAGRAACGSPAVATS